MLAANRWHVITESQFAWEEEGLQALRKACDPRSVLEAWTNFEIFDEQGKVYEIDALLLTTHCLLVVELKHWVGQIVVDESNWLRRTDPRAMTNTITSPLLLTNHKTRVLASLLRSRTRGEVARVWPMVFLTHPDSELRFANPSRRQPIATLRNIDQLVNGPPMQGRGPEALDASRLKATQQALAGLSLGTSRRREFRVGSYVLKGLLGDGPNYQDHLASHMHFQTVQTRVRTFSAADEEGRLRARRAAQREFELVRGLTHDSILSPRELLEYELGPALVYDFIEGAERLDQLVTNQERFSRLDLPSRLHLWAQIGEALRYAHQRRVYHRSLSPQNVLVLLNQEQTSQVKVMNWQTASAQDRTRGTVHLSELVQEETTAYMAPEILTSSLEADHSADLFSLGCLGYLLLSGTPPAHNQSELQDRLRESQGLDLLGVVDHLPEGVLQLVRDLTHPIHFRRPDSAEEFLRRLAEAEADYRQGFASRERVHDPTSAHPGEALLPGLVLVRRLGQGSTSLAFLVQRADNEERLVLKLALNPQHDDRLQQEAEVLSKLKHPTLVELKEVLRWQGPEGERLGLLLSHAGDNTLAQRLSQDGVIGLELLQRFGDDLLQAVEFLEKAGLPHRDIKPANLGVKLRNNKELRLVLFDFSLSRADSRQIEVGTPGYRDPFLHRDRRPWDVSAERFAAAATLFEMATGRVPQWGEDGRLHPGVVPDAPLQLLPGDFEPALRDAFVAFFRRALADKGRYDSALEMRQAWNAIFQSHEVKATSEAPADLPDTIESATPLSELTSQPLLLQTFDRLKVTTAGQLLGYRKAALTRLINTGAQTRALLLEFHAQLQQRVRGEILPQVVDPESTLEPLFQELLPRQPQEQQMVRLYLGDWLNGRDAASRARVEEKRYSGILLKARQNWMRHPQLLEVREGLAQALDELGGVATGEELGDALLRVRGSQSTDPQQRRFVSKAVLRAALEAEEGEESPRFLLAGIERSRRRRQLIARDHTLAQAIFQLANWADEQVASLPLPSLARWQSGLQAQAPAGEWPEGRLARLATSVAELARLSSRGEPYPRGMEAAQALQLCAASLGGRSLSLNEVRQLVKARYPEAADLPTNPEVLQKLFHEVQLALHFQPETGRFEPPSSTAHTSRTSTVLGDVPVSRSHLEARLAEAFERGSPQVLKVKARDQVEAEAWLQQRFGLRVRSLEGMLMQELRRLCQEHEIPWEETVLVADRQGPQGADWGNLRGLAEQACQTVAEGLSREREVLILKRFSLWARFGQLHRVGELLQHSGRREGPAAVVLLAPHSEGLPTVDGQPVPLPPATAPLEWSRSLVS